MLKLIGVLFVIGGLLYLVWKVLGSRTLSEPPRSAANVNYESLEPRGQGMHFLGLARNWPALAAIAIGAALLIFSA